jgi:type IV secretory pathway TraG/TraD family ATPase VirD4
VREPTFPSRWPGWALVTAVLAAGLLGVHVSFVGFAHAALARPGWWLRYLATGEGWQVAGILARCAPAGLFGGLVAPFQARQPPDPRQQWCQRWWAAFDHWSRREGGTFFGATILAAAAAGAWTYVAVIRRLVPAGQRRRRSATYATPAELRPYLGGPAMALDGALPLGRTVPHGGGRGVDLWLPLAYRPQHLWILGVTGAGKTSGAIKRWVATDAALDGVTSPVRMSTVAVDVKDPDLWEFAAPLAMRHQRRCLRWAPLGPDSLGHNFLDYVEGPADALAMAETILSNDPDARRKDPFWRGLERNFLALAIQMVAEEPPERFHSPLLAGKLAHVLGVVPPPRSLAFVLGLTHLHPTEFIDLVDAIDADRHVWRDRFATVFAAERDKAIGAWLGLQNVLVIFRDPHVIAATSRSDFHLATVALQPTTLIVGLPREPSPQRQVLTALFLRQLLATLAQVARERDPRRLAVPVTMLLDELGALGFIPAFPDYVATYRDLGVSFILATQDRSQLVELYGEERADTLVANLHTRIVFGRDLRPEQADEICRGLGEVQVPEPGVGYEHEGVLRVRRRTTRVMYTLRRLIEPNELRRMPDFHAIAVLPGDLKVQIHLPPVHDDPRLGPHVRPVSAFEALRHEMRMDRALGRIAPAAPERSLPSGQAWPSHSPTDLRDGGPEISPPPSARPPRAGGAASGRAFRTAQAAPADPRSQTNDGTAPTTTAEPARDPAPDGSGVPSSDAATGQPLASGGASGPADASGAAASSVAAFVEAVLAGVLRDARLPQGSPAGWVYADRRGEFLVPWGFFRDWAVRSSHRFIDLERRWMTEGVLRGRASVTAGGRPVTCLVFTKTAATHLSRLLQQAIAQRFARIPESAVRPSQGRAQGWGPDLPGGAGTQEHEPAPTESPPPHLKEFVNALEQAGEHFIGHPAYQEGCRVFGRWCSRSKDGADLLLVERTAVAELFARLGIADPAPALAAWQRSGLLYTRGQVRGGFYHRRTHPEGHEFLALRRDALARFRPPLAASWEECSHPRRRGGGARP